MSTTQRPRTTLPSVARPGSDAVHEVHPMGCSFCARHVDGAAEVVLDLRVDGGTRFYEIHDPRTGSVTRGTMPKQAGERVPLRYAFDIIKSAYQPRPLAMLDTFLSAVRLSGFAAHAGEGRDDDDAATVSENPQSLRATPKHVEVQLGRFAADAQERRGDADAATVSENPQSPRATPRYAEVRLATAEQMKRRDDLVAVGNARREYRKKSWLKRLVTHRP